MPGDVESPGIFFAARGVEAAMTQPQFDYGITFEEPEADDAAIDRWHDGALDCYRVKPKTSDDKDYLEGWAHAEADRQVQVVMPARPEGYYHKIRKSTRLNSSH